MRESDLKADPGRNICCCIGELDPVLNQLSYIPNQWEPLDFQLPRGLKHAQSAAYFSAPSTKPSLHSSIIPARLGDGVQCWVHAEPQLMSVSLAELQNGHTFCQCQAQVWQALQQALLFFLLFFPLFFYKAVAVLCIICDQTCSTYQVCTMSVGLGLDGLSAGLAVAAHTSHRA